MQLSKVFIAVISALCTTSAMANDINNNQEVTIDSVWDETSNNPSRIRVGYETDGALNIVQGGDVLTKYFHIGQEDSTGTVNVIDGGKLTVSAESMSYPFDIGGSIDGQNHKGTGTLNVSGQGSLVTISSTNAAALQVGAGDGNGFMNISDGGKVRHQSGGIWIGGRASSSGETSGVVSVDGTDSELWSVGSIHVGTYGSGSLTTSNGGHTHSEATISVGNMDETKAYDNLMSVKGADSIISSNDKMTVGLQGKGTAVASDSGILSAPEIVIAQDSGSSGELAVGARAGADAAVAGIIDTKKIVFGVGDGVLTLNHTNTDFVLDADISGTGSVNAESGVSTLSGDNSAFQGRFNISSPATLVISEQQNIGTNEITMTGGLLEIDAAHDWQFINTLTGQGVLQINAAGNTFDFNSSEVTENFNGTLALKDTLFSLAGTNTAALKNMLLSLGEGSVVSVGNGQQVIDELAFDGGKLVFGDVIPGQTESTETVHTTGDLDVSGKGTIQVTTGGMINNDTPTPNTHITLLEQDDGNSLIQLVSSDGDTIGSAGNLILTDQNGKVISDAVESSISQNGEVVAEGTYDYRLTSGENNDGLYISYGLTQVELLASGDNALALGANGNSGNAADLSARVTGNGDLAIDSQKGQTVSLSNTDNDYTGATDVRGGNLLMQNDNVLGQTSELRLAAETGFDMNGHSQTIDQLSAAADSLLNINGGSLTLQHGGSVDGTLAGSGELKIIGDTLTVTGENSALTAKTTIAEDASVLMNNTLGLGVGNIVAAGTLSLSKSVGTLYNNISDAGLVELSGSDVVLAGNNSDFSGQFTIDADSRLTASMAENLGDAQVSDVGSLVLNSESTWQLDNEIYGQGSVTKTGTGTITVGDNAAWTGQTVIEQGRLELGQADSPVVLASTQVTIHDGAVLSGSGGVAGNIDNDGMLLVGSVVSDNPQLFTVGGDLSNSGDLVTGIHGQLAGNQLVVKGNYTGNDGHLSLNAALGDDTSVTDKLVINGDTSGKTSVSVTNAGGKGAATVDGIEVIHVDGQSNGEFTQAGRIVAGAYDYTLGRGLDENSGNWYLTSGKTNPDPDPKPNPDTEKDLRPEGSSYTANLAAANNMFVTRLHDRQGETRYTDALTGEQKITNMWMRHVGGHNSWRDGSGQLKTQSNRYVLQLGGDIAQWSQNEVDRWHLGVMAGYGNEHNNTRSSRTGYDAKGSVNGYSAGVYATWYANDESHNGAYLDSWVQYNWFDNHVKGDDLQGESYKSSGVTASLETGYTQKLGVFNGSKGTLNEWYVQPQAQAVWMGVDADDHLESNGTRVSSNGSSNLQTRLGMKTWINSHHQMDNGKSREFQPFAEINWIHNSRDFSATMDGVNVRQNGAKNIGEVKVGVEGQVTSRLNLWGNVGVQVGDKGYNDSAAMVGVKWNF